MNNHPAAASVKLTDIQVAEVNKMAEKIQKVASKLNLSLRNHAIPTTSRMEIPEQQKQHSARWFRDNGRP